MKNVYNLQKNEEKCAHKNSNYIENQMNRQKVGYRHVYTYRRVQIDYIQKPQ